MSFAELGGAEEEEDEVAAGSDAALFVGAPLACLFIYLLCVPPSARAPLLGGEGVGGGPGKRGSCNRGETPRDLQVRERRAVAAASAAEKPLFRLPGRSVWCRQDGGRGAERGQSHHPTAGG